MSPVVASIVFGIGVCGLFFLDSRGNVRVSKALWIPTIWLFFCSSRSLAQWLAIDSTLDEANTYLEGSPFDRNFLLIIEAIALLVVISRGRRVAAILKRNWAIGIFFSYAAASMAWSDYPFVTFKHLTKGIGDVLMVLIILTESNIIDAIKTIFTRLGFVLVPLSLLLIWYYPSLGRTHTMDWTPEAIGVATQKNGLGELCDIYGLAFLWRFRSTCIDRKDSNRERRLVAFGVVLAMVIWLLHLCNSMTSICALSMASFVMLLSAHPTIRRKRAFVHILSAAVIVCTLYALFFQSSGSLVQSLGRDSTLSGRTSAWPELIKLVRNLGIGVGYESYWLGERLQKVWVITQGLRINEAHNGYVEVLLSLGWIGVALLGILIAIGYRNVIAAYRHDPDVGCLRVAWLLAIVITGLTEAAFRMMGLTWVTFLLVTATASWAPRRKLSAANVSSTKRSLKPDKELGTVHKRAIHY